MALRSLAGGLWVPTGYPLLANDESVYVIDASGEKAALILRCPRDGVLDRFDAHVAVVTNSPDNGLRFSFQGVNLTTGQPDGTILGATANASVTYAHPVATGWKSTNFTESVTVTRGQLIACVVDIPTFTAGDSVTLRATGPHNSLLPYGVSATSTKQRNLLLALGLHYTDGYAFISPTLSGANDIVASPALTTGTTPDEYALAFSLPFPFKLNVAQLLLTVEAGADFDVVLYDADGVTPLSTQAHDGDVTAGTQALNVTSFLASEVTLLANTIYRLALRPSTGSFNISVVYAAFASLALMETKSGGSAFFSSTRTNAGAWTDYNSGTFRCPFYTLNVSAVDDGVSAGGGGVAGGGVSFGESWG